jgi:hypothetical protein
MHTILARHKLRTDDAPAPTLRNHLFGCVLVAEHYAARVHRHLLVKRRHRCCINTIAGWSQTHVFPLGTLS